MHIGGKTRACAALLVAAVLSLSAFAATASALPSRFWGVVPQAAPSTEQFQRLQLGGVKSVRIPVDWSSLQPTKAASVDWTGVDLLVERAAKANIEVLPFITGAPTWAVPLAIVPGTGTKAPAHLPASGVAASGWKAFLQQAVTRYGPDGSFWATHPAVPVHPIRNWQIWNEENFKYFVAHPNPAEYGKLVKLSYAAVKAVDPGAQIILGGLFALPKGCRTEPKPKSVCGPAFLEQMYKKNPGIKTKFNGAALHPYTSKYQDLTGEIEEFRKVLAANKDSAKGLWITELGWSSKAPNPSVNVFAKGVAGQARELRGAFTLLRSKAVKWRLQRVYWFSVDDQPGACNFCDGSGLFAKGFAAKKSWFEFVKFTGGTP